MKARQGTLRLIREEMGDHDAPVVADWLCPACNTSRNSRGEPLLGSRAVALHIAGKIRQRDNLHRQWAMRRVGTAMNEPYVKRTINTLADALKPVVIEDNRIRRESEFLNVTSRIEDKRISDDPGIEAYKYTRELETTLHRFVRCVLEESFGKEEQGWWVTGVPTNIRAECAMRREEDPARDDAYSYTYLVDLKTIVDKNWETFQPRLQSARPRLKSKKEFLGSIGRLNELRNRVAHPVRMSISDEDLSFLCWFCDVIGSLTPSQYGMLLDHDPPS